MIWVFMLGLGCALILMVLVATAYTAGYKEGVRDEQIRALKQEIRSHQAP
jgi:hypothetical protein